MLKLHGFPGIANRFTATLTSKCLKNLKIR